MNERFFNPEKIKNWEKREEVKDEFKEYDRLANETKPDQDEPDDMVVLGQESDEFFAEYELAQLRKFPKDERKERLETVKDLIDQQKEGLVAIQAAVFGAILEEPEIDLEGLLTIAEALFNDFKINLDQKEIITGVIREIHQKHVSVHQYCERYPNPEELYGVVFSRNPEGPVKVIEGPITIYFRCADPVDYAFIHRQLFLRDNKQVLDSDIQAAQKSGGVSIPYSPIPELEGVIIAENANGNLGFGVYQRNALIHEEEHAIDRFISQEIISRKYLQQLYQYRNSDDELKKKVLTRFFRTRRAMQENYLKTELLAFIKENSISNEQITDYLMQKKENGGLYDYFVDEKEEIKSILMSGYQINLLDHYDHLLDKEYGLVFVEEWNKLILDGLNAYESLTSSRFSHDDTIARLRIEPVRNWKKEAIRALGIFTPPSGKQTNSSTVISESKW